VKKYLITGFAITLPITLTFAIGMFFVNLLTDPFVDIFRGLFSHYDLFKNGFLFLSAGQIQHIISQVLIIILLFTLITALGWLARWLFINYLISLWEWSINKIPFISPVYKMCKEAINSLFNSSNKAFNKVVMVPFPSKATTVMGFVTREDLTIPSDDNSKEESIISVFVPTTPNPTSGFLILYNPKEITYLDMKVDDALSYVISCGLKDKSNGDSKNTKT